MSTDGTNWPLSSVGQPSLFCSFPLEFVVLPPVVWVSKCCKNPKSEATVLEPSSDFLCWPH